MGPARPASRAGRGRRRRRSVGTPRRQPAEEPADL